MVYYTCKQEILYILFWRLLKCYFVILPAVLLNMYGILYL
nr:MAG TPA: hypothetical protein [Inoviridae sp.]